jgi:hypothetical protein
MECNERQVKFMADRVKTGNANLKGLMQNSNAMEHAFMYPSKLKGAPRGGNASVNTIANQKNKVVGSNATT